MYGSICRKQRRGVSLNDRCHLGCGLGGGLMAIYIAFEPEPLVLHQATNKPRRSLPFDQTNAELCVWKRDLPRNWETEAFYCLLDHLLGYKKIGFWGSQTKNLWLAGSCENLSIFFGRCWRMIGASSVAQSVRTIRRSNPAIYCDSTSRIKGKGTDVEDSLARMNFPDWNAFLFGHNTRQNIFVTWWMLWKRFLWA